MHVLAENGRYALFEDGPRLLFFERSILPTWLAFVAGLLAVIGLGNAIVQLILANVAVGAVLAAIGGAAMLGLRAVLRSRARSKAAIADPASALLVLDLASGTLLDGAGRALAPLDAVRVERAMQVTSSALALRIIWPGGDKVVYRGDALQPGGSIEPAVTVLRERGVPA